MKKIEQLRPWQVEAFQILRPARLGLCQAPGGSGKSLEQVMLAQVDIEDTGNKQLILVPQNHIHHSFFGHDSLEFTLPGSDHVSHWSVAHNLCEKRPDTGRRLREFLLEDVGTMRKDGRLTAISTHHAMVSVWKRLSADEKRKALRKISFRIDEAHHISNVFHEDELEQYNDTEQQAIVDDATKLGNIVRYVLRVNEPTVKLHLTTATFFRGDQKTIISKAFRQRFTQYCLPWNEHYETLGIDDLRFDFLEYDKTPVDMVLETIRSEPNERHLVIIPPLTMRYRTTESHEVLLQGLRQIYPEREVLDLVTPETQEQNKALLFQNPDRFHAVVACRLFDEGTDWVPCNRLHNTDAGEASLTLAVQRFFRPLRKHPAKKQVVIRNYVPRFSAELERDEQRQILSNRFNAVLACIVTQGELLPTVIPTKTEGMTKQPKRLSLQEAYGGEYHSVMEGLLRGYEALEDKTDAVAVQRVVDKVIEEHGRPEDVELESLRRAMFVQIGRIACPSNRKSNRRNLEPNTIDVESIRLQGFDKVWEKLSPVQSALCWGTDNITSQTVRELLRAVHEIPTLDEIKEAIVAYHSRTGKRPTRQKAVWIDELKRSAIAIHQICRNHYGLSLSQLATEVLGHPNDGLLEKTRELIHEYWARGSRLTKKFGPIPDIGMTALALNQRLERSHRTTLAAEVEKSLGSPTDCLTMKKVRLVIRNYLKKKVQIDLAYGLIPELHMDSRELDGKLRRNFKVNLDELVEDVKRKMIFNAYPPNLSLADIHQGIRDFYQTTGERPNLQMKGHICGKRITTVHDLCRTYHNTTLSREVRKVLGDPNEGWLNRLHAVIDKYWKRGVRINAKSGYIPELDMKVGAIRDRLRRNYNSNLAKEFCRVVEMQTK